MTNGGGGRRRAWVILADYLFRPYVFFVLVIGVALWQEWLTIGQLERLFGMAGDFFSKLMPGL